MENGRADRPFVAALRFSVLTRFYDGVMASLFDERKLQGRLVERASCDRSRSVLDLGCGTGTVALRVAGRGGSRVIGLDADLEAIVIASRKATAAGVTTSWCAGSADAMPFRERAFGQVVSSLMFHHLSTTRKRGALTEARRVLRPGGVLHTMDWGRPIGPLMRLAFLPVRLLDGFASTAENARGEIGRLIAESGFTVSDDVESRRTVCGVIEFHRAVR